MSYLYLDAGPEDGTVPFPDADARHWTAIGAEWAMLRDAIPALWNAPPAEHWEEAAERAAVTEGARAHDAAWRRFEDEILNGPPPHLLAPWVRS